jgi:hypothetical protein
VPTWRGHERPVHSNLLISKASKVFKVMQRDLRARLWIVEKASQVLIDDVAIVYGLMGPVQVLVTSGCVTLIRCREYSSGPLVGESTTRNEILKVAGTSVAVASCVFLCLCC